MERVTRSLDVLDVQSIAVVPRAFELQSAFKFAAYLQHLCKLAAPVGRRRVEAPASRSRTWLLRVWQIALHRPKPRVPQARLLLSVHSCAMRALSLLNQQGVIVCGRVEATASSRRCSRREVHGHAGQQEQGLSSPQARRPKEQTRLRAQRRHQTTRKIMTASLVRVQSPSGLPGDLPPSRPQPSGFACSPALAPLREPHRRLQQCLPPAVSRRHPGARRTRAASGGACCAASRAAAAPRLLRRPRLSRGVRGGARPARHAVYRPARGRHA